MSERLMNKIRDKMKTGIRAWNRVPRCWKLALNAVAIPLLLFGTWLTLDCPCLTAQGAFRRSMEQWGWPKEDPELVLRIEKTQNYPTEERVVGLRADGTNTYVADMEWDMGWRPDWHCKTVPAVDGICYMPLLGSLSLRGPYDCFYFAVKESGADASLTLILGESEYGPGGRFHLDLVEARNGWLVFYGGEKVTYLANSDEERRRMKGENRSFEAWKSGSKVPASLELVTRDADGNVLKEISWDLP